jgi:multidrug efflux pump
MIFTDVFIKRPIFATAISLMILLAGFVALLNIQVREFPDIDVSVVTVTVTYPGANSQLMESFVAYPMEQAVSGVDGIDYMTSVSQQNTTKITVYMKLGYDIDRAMTEISAKVSSVRWQMPKNINDPVIDKEDPNAQPILYYSFSGRNMSPEQVTDYLIRVVQPQMETVNGVSQAEIFGERKYAMRVWLNPKLMAAQHVTPTDIKEAIEANNVQAPAGNLKGLRQQFDVHATTDLNTAKGFDNIFIRNDNGRIVRIKDIGEAQLGAENDDFSVIMNGKNTTVIGIIPKSNANPLQVADNIKKLMPGIKAHFPKDMHVKLMWDSSLFISASLKEVISTLIEACIFVFIVIFLMLGSLRAVLVPTVTIPLSIIGTCAIMMALHFTLNTMTMLAFVLAIGLVVDDAIVVLENVHRHLAQGLSPFKSAIIGAREIAFAVIAMTLTLAAVYTPIGFMSGLTGVLFSEFAFTLASAVLVSGFLALTLSPMMCSKLYRENENIHAGFPGLVNRCFDKITNGYKYALKITIKMRYLVIIVAAVIYVSCYFLYISTPSEMVPTEDQGAIMGIVVGPASANLAYTESQTKYFAAIYSQIPEMQNYGIINGYPNGVSSAVSFLVLTPWDQRKRTAMQITNWLFPKFWSIPGVLAYPSIPPLLPGASGFTPISFVLKTTNDYDYLYNYSQKFIASLKQWGGLLNIDNDLKIDMPQTYVDVDRNKISDLGISSNKISTALSIFLGKPITTWFSMQGRSYEVLPQLYRVFRLTPVALNNLNVRTQSGQLVPLSNLVKITEKTMPRTLNHFQQLRSATITANLSPDVTQGQAYNYMLNLANKMLPTDIQTDTADQLRQYVQAQGTMVQTFIFAVIFIYLVLAAQFESFRDPFIVMLSVPLSIAGALGLLLPLGGTLNIYTQIGLVTLVGLITKNGILIVEFANQQQEKGLEFLEALLTGASLRLRPILMTTFCLLLGVLPLIFASGAGAVSRHQMGLILFGGMSFGTLLTLFVVPTAYYFMATKKAPDPHIKELEEIDSAK